MNKRFPKWTIAPALLGVVAVPFGLYSVQLCACTHPVEVYIGRSPLKLSEEEIKRRLLGKFPAGSPRSRIAQELRSAFGPRIYANYCRFTPPVQQLDCTFVLEQGLYGLREKGVTLTFAMDNSDRLRVVDAVHFTRYQWNWRPAGS